MRLLLTLGLLVGCTPMVPAVDGGSAGGRSGAGGGSAGAFSIVELDPAARGLFPMAMAVDAAEDRVVVAYFTPKGTQTVQAIEDLNLNVVEWKSGVVSPVQTIRFVQRAPGLAVALHPTTKEPTVAFLGGPDRLLPNAPSVFWFQHDASLATRSGSTWTEVAAATLGDVCAPVGSPMGASIVGLWPALRFETTGRAIFAYRDIHFAQNTTDSTGSDLEAELEAMKEVARPKTAQLPALDPGLQKEADESRARAEVAEERVTALEAELAEARQAQARVEDLEAELDQAKKALSAAEQQLSTEQAAARDVLAKFAAVDAELATVREMANKAAELEGQLASSKARVWELEQLKTEADTKLTQQLAVAESAQARVSELTSRIAQLENDLSGIRSRRDELNVELARAENDRKKLTARVSDLEASLHAVKDDEAKARATLETQHQQALAAIEAKRAEADGLFQKEKEKHQHTAQRLLEARQKTREVETQLADAQAQLTAAATRFTEAENAARVKLAALEAEHAAAVARERESHVAITATLQAHVAQVEKDLAHATEEWHHTNRQYEQLHREMIVLLDQRDEARRQLEALR